MTKCFNTNTAYIDFDMLVHDKFFVDKSQIIDSLNTRIHTKNRYLCITKPRRFGKTSVLNMIGAYYCKAYDSKQLFYGLNICKSKTYAIHQNKYNVISLSLNEIPLDQSQYLDYIKQINNSIIYDIKEAYPALRDKEFDRASDILTATNDTFIFIIDEWDYIFSHELYPEHHSDFLEYLRNLLKDRPYVLLVYMTGVLPIKKYSNGSALNMFDEYTMLNDCLFEEYFGFTEKEVKTLCEKQTKLSIDTIREWYNGYLTSTGIRIYNPRSVVLALINGYCQSYWTRTGKMDEVLFFLKYNIGEVRDDVLKMINDIPVRIDIKKEYSAGQAPPANRKDIYSAMIIYGFLSYYNGELSIPNKELMIEFENAVEDNDFGYVAELVRNSSNILDATLDKKGDIVASYLHNIHNSELPILKYNDENSLSCVITLAYLSARNKYKVEREEKSGKGYVDFIFYPRQKNLPGIIIELKADNTPDAAITQIKEKEYSEKLKKEKVEHTLAVGINYNTHTKEHQCIIEEL